jgi:hypothetical protein
MAEPLDAIKGHELDGSHPADVQGSSQAASLEAITGDEGVDVQPQLDTDQQQAEGEPIKESRRSVFRGVTWYVLPLPGRALCARPSPPSG